MNGDVGVTIATHGWIGTEMTGGRFMLEEGAEMQWKEEREVCLSVPIPRLCTSICSVNSLSSFSSDYITRFPLIRRHLILLDSASYTFINVFKVWKLIVAFSKYLTAFPLCTMPVESYQIWRWLLVGERL